MNSKPVLYVEDEKNDIVFMQHAFTQAQVQNRLITVPDGQAAVEYLDGRGKYADREEYPLPMLVLLDLNLPRKPGLEVLKWIRQHQTCQTLPVVVVTSSNREVDIQRSYALGANAYVIKPAMINELEEAVRIIKEFWLTLNQPPIIPPCGCPPDNEDGGDQHVPRGKLDA